MVPNIEIVFELQGRRQRLVFRDLPLRWWNDLKAQAGLTLGQLLQGLDNYDVNAIVAMVWLVRRRDKKSLSYPQVYNDLSGTVEFELIDLIRDGESMMPQDDEDDLGSGVASGIGEDGDEETPPGSESSS